MRRRRARPQRPSQSSTRRDPRFSRQWPVCLLPARLLSACPTSHLNVTRARGVLSRVPLPSDTTDNRHSSASLVDLRSRSASLRVCRYRTCGERRGLGRYCRAIFGTLIVGSMRSKSATRVDVGCCAHARCVSPVRVSPAACVANLPRWTMPLSRSRSRTTARCVSVSAAHGP